GKGQYQTGLDRAQNGIVRKQPVVPFQRKMGDMGSGIGLVEGVQHHDEQRRIQKEQHQIPEQAQTAMETGTTHIHAAISPPTRRLRRRSTCRPRSVASIMMSAPAAPYGQSAAEENCSATRLPIIMDLPPPNSLGITNMPNAGMETSTVPATRPG